jgi:hypothetical protein
MNRPLPKILAVALTLSSAVPAQDKTALPPPHKTSRPSVRKLSPYAISDPNWYDWQIRWENVHADAVTLKFRDFATLHSFFNYYFLQRSVMTSEVDCYDIPLLDSVLRAGQRLGFTGDDFSRHKKVQFYILAPDRHLILAHIQLYPTFVEALFKKHPDSWYHLVGTVESSHVRYWQPSFYLFTTTTARYLVIPDFQGGTGSNFHEEKLMVFDLSKDNLDMVVEEYVYRSVTTHAWAYLTSTMQWDPRAERITLFKEAASGQLEKKQGYKKISKVTFDLKNRGTRTEKVLAEDVIATSGTRDDYRGKSHRLQIIMIHP